MAFGGVATGNMKAQVAAIATGITRSIGSSPSPTATPPIRGRKAAAVAVLLVSSVRPSTISATAAIRITTGRKPKPATCSPTHLLRPVSVNCADRASPPPKSSRMSQGSSFAAPQFSSGTPLRRLAGMMNNATATHIAMTASSMGVSGHSSGTVIQEAAASTKITSTSFSPTFMRPSFWYSSEMSLRPPGISVISGVKITKVSRYQAMAMKTTDMGTPTSIHWPKPMLMSWACCR